jgi:mono/diheme cytochrome c family protein
MMTERLGRPRTVNRKPATHTSSFYTHRRARFERIVITGILCVAGSLLFSSLTLAASGSGKRPGDQARAAEQGRALFNGKGMCSTCHGIDGYRDRLPEHLTSNVRENIAHLDPQPADLRNAAGLTLATDKQRFEAIRHGRLRSAMHPLSKEILSDEDILSLLAYLASIRDNAVPSSVPSKKAGAIDGGIEKGRRVYHEIGGCAVCHGIEGRLKNKPNLSADLKEKLSRLQPPPADFRNHATLKAENDHDRFRSIKYGHPGTAMFPKTLLRDEDIWDLIAYLNSLRGNKQ